MENSQYIVLAIGGACLVVGVILIYLGTRSSIKLRAIRETATVEVCQVAGMAQAVGSPLVEIKGTAVSDQPLISPRSQTPCVYYSYKMEHRIRRNVRDNQGNIRTEERWNTAEDRKEHIPFLLVDSTGQVWVRPDGAKFVADSSSYEGHGRPGTDDRSVGSMVGDMVGGVLSSMGGRYEDVVGYRVTEAVIRVGQPLYVLGNASCSPDGTPSVGRGDGPFIISHKMKEELTKRFGRNYVLQYVFGAILAVGGIAAVIYAAAAM